MNDDRRATRWRSPDEPCLNCGDATPGRYCPSCGQRKAEVLVSVRALVADVLEDQLVLNRALPRTLGALLFHPGLLTEEYVRGRIVRYIAPFRLYLVSSVVFFLLLSFVGLDFMDVNADVTPDADAAIDSASVAIDSATSALRLQQDLLAEMDTAAMPEAARAAVREQMAELVENFEARPDVPPPPVQIDLNAPALPPGILQPWARTLADEFEDYPPPFAGALQRKLVQVGHLPTTDAIREVLRDLLEYAPHMVFLLLPLFALILKLLYIRRGRYYAEHFVFALHVHAFVFTMFTVMFILPWDWVNGLLFLWIMAYVWLALRRVYRQGWVRTTAKWWTLGATYFIFLGLGMVGLGIVTLLLT
ncbi:MAG TPA: DUF3667 domain-containing protein [Longimicrobiales bacterium]|nr:DUF3667 domain-containing protein [Longimicrobiales bacterium]